MASNALRQHEAKRSFSVTSEPADNGHASAGTPSFVVQKHWARHLHYDFRLELGGTMKSWAVRKGPSLDSRDKRMAVQVEDHLFAYSSLEGTIPAGQYGAGKVIICDRGTWKPVGDASQGYRAGQLKFELTGQKLRGNRVLVRMQGKDEFVRSAAEFSVVDEMPDTVKSSRQPVRKPGGKRYNVPAVKSAVKMPAIRPGQVDLPVGATKAPMPATFAPQLATLVE